MAEQISAVTTSNCPHCQRRSQTVTNTLEHSEFRMSEPTREGGNPVSRHAARFWICKECRYTAEHSVRTSPVAGYGEVSS